MGMSELTAYRAIRAHFSQEGAERCVDPSTGDCYYRSPYTDHPAKNRCAAGVLIPDDIITKLDNAEVSYEGTAASEVFSHRMLSELLDPDFRLDVLDSFQHAHDSSNSVDETLSELKETALAHGVIDTDSPDA